MTIKEADEMAKWYAVQYLRRNGYAVLDARDRFIVAYSKADATAVFFRVKSRKMKWITRMHRNNLCKFKSDVAEWCRQNKWTGKVRTDAIDVYGITPPVIDHICNVK